MKEIFKSSLFNGFPGNVIPRHDVKAVSDNKFIYIGKMIATCIVQGGEVPACFATACIVLGRVCSPVCLEDIPDFDVKCNLKRCNKCKISMNTSYNCCDVPEAINNLASNVFLF